MIFLIFFILFFRRNKMAFHVNCLLGRRKFTWNVMLYFLWKSTNKRPMGHDSLTWVKQPMHNLQMPCNVLPVLPQQPGHKFDGVVKKSQRSSHDHHLNKLGRPSVPDAIHQDSGSKLSWFWRWQRISVFFTTYGNVDHFVQCWRNFNNLSIFLRQKVPC